MNTQHLPDSFPLTKQFLGGWFPDADFDQTSDSTIVTEYCSVYSLSQVNNLLSELYQILGYIDDYWLSVEFEANRHFDSAAAAHE